MVKEIPLQNGMVALVDDEDFERVNKFNWHVTQSRKSSVAVVRNNGNSGETMRSFILKHSSKNEAIISINKNPLDFRKSNLKVVDRKEIGVVTRGHKNSTSKYKGVCFEKATNKWRATCSVGGKRINIGRFTNEDEAALAYNETVKQINPNAFLNEIGKNNNVTPIELECKTLRRKPKHIEFTSKFKGVFFHKREKKWELTIPINGKRKFAGYYKSEIEAAKAYDQKAYELHGDKAILNFPELIEEYKQFKGGKIS